MRSESVCQIEEVPCEGCRRAFTRAVGDPEYLCPPCRRRRRIPIGEGTESEERDGEPEVYKAIHMTHPLECEGCGRLFQWDSDHVDNEREDGYGFCPCGGVILFR